VTPPLLTAVAIRTDLELLKPINDTLMSTCSMTATDDETASVNWSDFLLVGLHGIHAKENFSTFCRVHYVQARPHRLEKK